MWLRPGLVNHLVREPSMGKLDTSAAWNLGQRPEQEIIFSSRDGYVWASWPGAHATMRLGRTDLVSHMMRDFLAQEDVGERLTARSKSIRRG